MSILTMLSITSSAILVMKPRADPTKKDNFNSLYIHDSLGKKLATYNLRLQ